MPASLVANEVIPQLAATIDSPTVFRILQRLRQAGFIANGPDMDEPTVAALRRLSDLGLVDPGYEGPTNGKPFVWLSNHNGERVLRYLESLPAEQRAKFESKVGIHSKASIALSALSDQERWAVLGAAEALAMADPGSWPKQKIVPLAEGRRLYLLRVSDELRAFIQIRDDGALELVDVVRPEILDLFRAQESKTGATR